MVLEAQDQSAGVTKFLVRALPLLISSHGLFLVLAEGAGESPVSSSLYKGITFMTYSNPTYLPKAPPPNTITLRVKASTYESEGGGHNSDDNTAHYGNYFSLA